MTDKKINEVVSALSDAITASGRPLNEINKTSINDFLQKSRVDNAYWDYVYQKLSEIHTPKGSVDNSGKEWKDANWSDDLPSTPTTVSQKQPRKTVFGQIKKIAG